MISKELLIKTVECHTKFNDAIDRLGENLFGNKYNCYALYESDWVQEEGKLFDYFIYSYFTESGADLIFAYLYEDCKEFWINKGQTLFEDAGEEHYTYNSLEELYDVMLKFKNNYFLE